MVSVVFKAVEVLVPFPADLASMGFRLFVGGQLVGGVSVL